MNLRIHIENPQRCQGCGARGKVTDSRLIMDAFRRRRYRCPNCDNRWSTWETLINPRRIASRIVPKR